MKGFWKFIKDENGLETVEYAVMAGLIVLAMVATVTLLGGSINTIFTTLESKLTSAGG